MSGLTPHESGSIAIVPLLVLAVAAVFILSSIGADCSSADHAEFTDGGISYVIDGNVLTISSEDGTIVDTPSMEGTTVIDMLLDNGIECAEDVTSVIYDDTISGISEYSFQARNEIASVTFGNNITHIDQYAFNACNYITVLNLPSAVEYIGEEAFSSTGLSELTIGENVEFIGNYAFADIDTLTKVVIKAQSIDELCDDIFDSSDPELMIYVPAGTAASYREQWEQYESIISEWVDKPVCVTGLIYDGNEKTGVQSADGFTLTGNIATNADAYTAKATLIGDNIWADGTADVFDIDWSIGKATITAVTTSFSPTYNGEVQLPAKNDLVFNGLSVSPDHSKITISLNGTDGKSAVIQTLSVSVSGDGNFNDISSVTATYTIQKATVTSVTTSFSPTYNRSIQLPAKSDLVFNGLSVSPDPSKIAISLDDTDGISAMEQKLKLSLSGDTNFNDFEDISLAYTIKKAEITSLSVDFNPTYSGYEQCPAFSDIQTNLDFMIAEDVTISCDNNIDAGEADVTVTSNNQSIIGSAYSTFNIKKAPIASVSVKDTVHYVYCNDEITPAFSDLLISAPGTINADDVTVTAYDNINAGTATVAVTAKSESKNYTGDSSANFTIEKAPIGKITLKDSITFVFSGSAHKPTFDQISIDVPGTITSDDVSISAENNINAGTATLIVTAKDGSKNYTGESSAEFTIEKAAITAVSLKEDVRYTYNGKAQTPEFVQLRITAPGTITSADVSISASENIDAGTAAYTVSAKEDSVNYKGSVDSSFTIEKFTLKTVSIIPSASYTYKGSPIVPSFDELIITAPGTIASSDVVITASNNINAGTADLTVSSSENSKNYEGTVNTTFAINKSTFTKITIAEGTSFTYNGDAQTPTFVQLSITAPGSVSADDVAITASDNIDAGTATFTVTAKESSVNYCGEYSSSFTIGKFILKSVSVKDGIIFTYNGEKQNVQFSQLVISAPGPIAESDVSITTENNINAGTASYSVTAKESSRNYSGSVQGTFTIGKADLVSVAMKDGVSFTYDKKEHIPEFDQLVIIAPGEISANDVIITAENNILAGDATVTVSAKDGSVNYKGSAQCTFTISKRSVERPIEKDNEFLYTGSPIEFTIPASDWYSVQEKTLYGTDIGTYTFHLIPDSNCLWSEKDYDGTYRFYIKSPLKSHTNKDNVEDVIILSSKGIREDFTVSVNTITDRSDIGKIIGASESSIKYIYDIKIMNGEKETEPGSPVIVKILLPEGIGDDFIIYHIHGDDTKKIDHTVDGKYAVISIDEFSLFAFVTADNGTASGINPIIIIVAVLAAVLVIAGIIIYKKKASKQ